MLRSYVDRRQTTVAEWVAPWPIFDVCVREMGNEGGGETLGAVVEARGIRKSAEGHGRIYFGSGKVAASTGNW